MHHAIIRVLTEKPDYSDVPDSDYNWSRTVYSAAEEILPVEDPEQLDKPVALTTYVGANIYHDMVSRCSVSIILHLINKKPSDWYSKKQSIVETATYDSEFVAARIATAHIIEHCTMLRYLGISVGENHLHVW